MEPKVFNDPIHGQVKIHPLCIKIIDTPQFQRLRRIKQLGGVYHVYYGASHNRFEHSIGVCHLAGQLLKHLQREQPELGIDYRDILCVEVAGLCHDLGHGPFSHLWDKSILRCLGKPNWKHEEGSVKLFDHLVAKNGLKKEFQKYLKIEDDTELEKELTFIKELISGKTGKNGGLDMNGRLKEKAFLYEVIANKENGIDVDKWDYFARDCYYLGLPKNFDHQRLMSFARVLDITDKKIVSKQICYRDKEASNLYGMFYTRNLLHQKAYQHKTVKAIECMLADALVCSNTLLKFRGKDGDMKDLVETIDDMEAYAQVDDEVIGHIMKMTPGDLENDEDKTSLLRKAQEILKRIEKRQIYQCLRSNPINSDKVKEFAEKTEKEKLLKIFTSRCPQIHMIDKDFSLERVSYDYGMKREDPVRKVYFYRKSKPDESTKIPKTEVSMMLPETFSETRILLFYKKFMPKQGKDNDKEDEEEKDLINKVAECFKEYCEPLYEQDGNQ